jgi:hypothetical protein
MSRTRFRCRDAEGQEVLVRGVCVARHLFMSSAVAARFGARVTVMAAAWLWWHVEEIQS